jgi:hypothetical protein
MGPVLITLIAIVVVSVLLLVTREWVARRATRADDLARADSAPLDYLVPTGQDPAVITAALSAEGYAAAPQPGETHLLHISCPAGQERERAHVRATISGGHRTGIDDAQAHFDLGTVRFVDEASPE